MHKGRISCVACLYGHKITANNEESDNKMKERIGEGGNGWGQGRDKRERRGEEKGRRESNYSLFNYSTGDLWPYLVFCISFKNRVLVTCRNLDKMKERIGEGGNGWGQGRDKRERRGEEIGSMELKGR